MKTRATQIMNFIDFCQHWYFHRFLTWFDNLSEFSQRLTAFMISMVCYTICGTVLFFSILLQVSNEAHASTIAIKTEPTVMSATQRTDAQRTDAQRTDAQRTDDSIKVALQDTPHTAKIWMQCDQLDAKKRITLGKSEFFLTPNGRLIRLKSDFRDKYTMRDSIRHFWYDLAHTLDRRGMKLSLAPVPPRSLLKDYDRFAPQEFSTPAARMAWKQFVRRWRYLGIDFIDLMPVIQNLGLSAAFARDHHWTPEAAQLAARHIADYMIKDKVIAAAEKQEYDLLQSEQEIYGGYAQQYEEACNLQPPVEIITFYEAEWVTEDIFADPPAAMVAVTGASNLNPEFGFAANLSHTLSLPVDNMSISGGGFHHGILSVLTADPDQSLPYWLVWVTPSYQSEIFKIKDQHREVLAAAQGRCTADNAILSVMPKVTNKTVQYTLSYTEKGQSEGALYAQFNTPRHPNGNFAWSVKKSIQADLITDNDDQWQHIFLRKRKGVSVYSLNLPTDLEWDSLTLTLHVKARNPTKMIPEPIHLCRSAYLQHWPLDIAFDASNRVEKTVKGYSS